MWMEDSAFRDVVLRLREIAKRQEGEYSDSLFVLQDLLNWCRGHEYMIETMDTSRLLRPRGRGCAFEV